MTRDEPLRLFDSGDLYGLMLLAVRAWLAKYHPEVVDAVLLGQFAVGSLPGLQVPFTLAASSGISSSPPH